VRTKLDIYVFVIKQALLPRTRDNGVLFIHMLYVLYFKFYLSMFVTALKHLISRPYIPPFHYTILKSRIKELIECYFSNKNREQWYQCLVIGKDKSYFVKSHSQSKKNGIIQMLDFLITTYLSCLVSGCFIKRCVLQWVRFVSTCLIYRLPSRAFQV